MRRMRTVAVNARRIYKARLDAGMSQADVAQKLRNQGHKATERSIRRWETGANAPHANVVPALAGALGVSLESLYESGDEDEESSMTLDEFPHFADSADHAG